MRKINKKESKIEIHKKFLAETTKLASSGFGLVAALAWNELIKELVTQYIKPFAGASSGIISLLIYALIVTILAVAITTNLAKLADRSS